MIVRHAHMCAGWLAGMQVDDWAGWLSGGRGGGQEGRRMGGRVNGQVVKHKFLHRSAVNQPLAQRYSLDE